MTDHASTRVYSEQDRMLPRFLIRGVIALICAILAIATFARVTDRPLESTPPASPVQAQAEVVLVSDGSSGAVSIAHPDGRAIAILTPEEGGFIAGVHRAILRERTNHRVALEAPVVLSAFENGRLAITDPSTGWSADLMGFGADNASAFARLLAQAQGGNTHGTTD